MSFELLPTLELHTTVFTLIPVYDGSISFLVLERLHQSLYLVHGHNYRVQL